MYGRNQHSIVKQLSFNWKQILKKAQDMSLFYKIYGSRFNFPFPTPSLCPPLPTFLLLTTKHRLCKWKASTSNLSVLYMSFWAISTTYVPQPYRQVCMASEIHGYTSVHPLSSLRSPVWVSQHLPSYYCLPAPVFPQMSTQVDFSALLNVFLSLYKFCAFSLMLCFYFLTLTQSLIKQAEAAVWKIRSRHQLSGCLWCLVGC